MGMGYIPNCTRHHYLFLTQLKNFFSRLKEIKNNNFGLFYQIMGRFETCWKKFSHSIPSIHVWWKLGQYAKAGCVNTDIKKNNFLISGSTKLGIFTKTKNLDLFTITVLSLSYGGFETVIY